MADRASEVKRLNPVLPPGVHNLLQLNGMNYRSRKGDSNGAPPGQFVIYRDRDARKLGTIQEGRSLEDWISFVAHLTTVDGWDK